jgi:hypothetical protein
VVSPLSIQAAARSFSLHSVFRIVFAFVLTCFGNWRNSFNLLKLRHVLHKLLIGFFFMLPFLIRRNEKSAACPPRNQTNVLDKTCGVEYAEAAKACAVELAVLESVFVTAFRQCSVVSCLLSQILYDELVRQSFAPGTRSTRSHLPLPADVRV